MSEQPKPAEGGMQPGSPEVKETFAQAAQRHHDYYVGLNQAGKLPEEDRPNLELAKQREAKGEVKAFTPKPETSPTESK